VAGRIATVDYSVPLSVRVNLDTKEATEVWLHLDSFQVSPRGRFRSVSDGLGHDGTETWFRDVFIDLEPEVSGEFCDGEHPWADEAFAIADRVSITNSEFKVAFSLRPERKPEEQDVSVDHGDLIEVCHAANAWASELRARAGKCDTADDVVRHVRAADRIDRAAAALRAQSLEDALSNA
jgi:hypothetical protein